MGKKEEGLKSLRRKWRKNLLRGDEMELAGLIVLVVAVSFIIHTFFLKEK